MTSSSGFAPHSDVILERLLALHPKRIDLSLDRLFRLLHALGDPQKRAPRIIHVAGTNGKGSVCAYLRAGLEASGARVHVYASPHLVRFHERIRLAGKLVDEDRLADALARCEDANAGEPITFFEITTAAAFLLFAEEPADWLVLEVGLGGRLDATNVIDAPAATAVTSIGYDHQDFLGDTLAEIATEKAGILKPNVYSAVAAQAPEALQAIKRSANRVGATISVEGEDWSSDLRDGRLEYQDAHGLLDLPTPRLVGRHQSTNAGVAVSVLRHLGFGEDALAGAMRNADQPARLQRLRRGPLTEVDPGRPAEFWLDGGHNPAAGAAIADFFADLEERSPAPLFLICGMLTTKPADDFLRPFHGLARRMFALRIDGEPASYSAADLAQAAIRAGLRAEAVGSPQQAVKTVFEELDGARYDVAPRILVCGSLYLAGQILRTHS